MPSQTGDELAALVELPVSPFSGFVMLQLAVALLSFSAWYWARTAVAARYEAPDTRGGRDGLPAEVDRCAYEAVPRLLFGMGSLLGLAVVVYAALEFHRYLLGDVLVWALWSGVGYALVHRRLKLAEKVNKGRSERIEAAAAARAAFVRQKRKASRTPNLSDAPRYPVPAPKRLWAGVVTRFVDFVSYAPFGWRVAASLLLVCFIAFVAGAVYSYQPLMPGQRDLAGFMAVPFPGPAVVIVALAMMAGPFAALAYIVDGLRLVVPLQGRPIGFKRPPVFLALLLVIAIAPFVFHLHTVRTVAAEANGPAIAKRATLGAFWQRWQDACVTEKGPIRPVIVSVSGGASRAGVWATNVLRAVQNAAGSRNTAVFAVDSVSGGSLGVAAYMAIMAAHTDAAALCGRTAATGAQLAALTDPQTGASALGGDALGPVFGATLLIDVPRALLSPFAAIVRAITGAKSSGGDRAETIERAFERLWQETGRAAKLGTVPAMSDGFLTLFYKDGQPRPGMPLWLALGTDVASGARLITAPFNSDPDSARSSPKGKAPDPDELWPFSGAKDVLRLLCADVPISTAINNTARFPFLEPSGELVPQPGCPTADGPQAQIVDGGYFDNEGIFTALELAAWLTRHAPKDRAVMPIIVQVSASEDIVGTWDETARQSKMPPPFVQCGFAPVDRAVTVSQPSDVVQAFVPIKGLDSVRGAHDEALLHQAMAGYCDTGTVTAADGKPKDPTALRPEDQAFFHFYLFGEKEQKGGVPLNWLLSPRAIASIHGGMYGPAGAAWTGPRPPNARELCRMQIAFGRSPDPAPPPPPPRQMRNDNGRPAESDGGIALCDRARTAAAAGST